MIEIDSGDKNRLLEGARVEKLTKIGFYGILRDFTGILRQFECKLTSLEHAPIYLGLYVRFKYLGPKII